MVIESVKSFVTLCIATSAFNTIEGPRMLEGLCI